MTHKPYPRYYAVNDLPVKLVKLADDDVVDVLVFDRATGSLVSNPDYLSLAFRQPGDVNELSECDFETLVQKQRIQMRRCLAVELRAFDGERTETMARFVMAEGGKVEIFAPTENAVQVTDEMTANGIPGPMGTMVTRDAGMEFLRLLAQNFRGSRFYATEILEMAESDAMCGYSTRVTPS